MIDTKIFNNTKRAFILKSEKDLKRSIFIFKLMNIPLLVPLGIFFTKIALKLRLPIEWIIKKTVFEQFCGGTTQKDCLPLIKLMYSKHVYSVLDYSVEGKSDEKEFEKVAKTKAEIIKFASEQKEIPFAVAKPTGLGRFKIWEKVSQNEELSSSEQSEWNRIQKRVKMLCQTAADYNTKLMFDAEETWMQKAVDDLIEEMMKIYNRDKAIIFNTIQCYRWDRLAYLKDIHERAKKENFKLGFKIVRGAYMEKENARARRKRYQTPICEDKEATDVNFNAIMCYCIDNIDDIATFIGTHNEVSTYMALQLMSQKGLKLDDDRVWFGQLYGMSDHISYNLGEECSNAIKLVPFGPVRDVVPYLFRRAQENSSVQGQSSRELSLLLEEKERRKGQYVKRVN
ncbi:proline dehydrogenase family protein [Flavobacterium sp. CS20]|uniref:proline dehydrogenase family protein n=1 Tax=Flavobacterium sp. CS20 TaxID=2775246 RepID=UPI001B3A0EFA|nr:proline dehydrogenase family protein [Flavobacterium sp. CS20]QTY28041.1 proline dehydrogenase family protein [Flavobacterium sp. CS20]